MTATQNKTVLTHLSKIGPLTHRQASKLYGIDRLSARIYDLQAAGWEIPRRIIRLKSGKRVAEYMGVRRAK